MIRVFQRVVFVVLVAGGAAFGCSGRSTTPSTPPPSTGSGMGEGTGGGMADGSGMDNGSGTGSGMAEGSGAAATCSKQCVSDGDCACGRDARTNQCAYGNKSCIDTTKQCPDFCTGIGGQLQLKCIQGQCTLQ